MKNALIIHTTFNALICTALKNTLFKVFFYYKLKILFSKRQIQLSYFNFVETWFLSCKKGMLF